MQAPSPTKSFELVAPSPASSLTNMVADTATDTAANSNALVIDTACINRTRSDSEETTSTPKNDNLMKRIEQLPWLREYRPSEGCKGGLYDTSEIMHLQHEIQIDSSPTSFLFIELFFKHRYFKRISYGFSLAQQRESWPAFIANFGKNPKQWLSNFRKLRDSFENTENYGFIMKTHRLSKLYWRNACAVPPQVTCNECVFEEIDQRVDYDRCSTYPDVQEARNGVICAYRLNRIDALCRSAKEFVPLLNSPKPEKKQTMDANVFQNFFQIQQDISSMKTQLLYYERKTSQLQEDLSELRTKSNERIAELERKLWRLENNQDKRRKVTLTPP